MPAAHKEGRPDRHRQTSCNATIISAGTARCQQKSPGSTPA
jgi:hypothetical protein